MSRKHFLGGGLILQGLLFLYLLWFYPPIAGIMALGALGGGMFLEFVSAYQQGKEQVTTPENEWTGI